MLAAFGLCFWLEACTDEAVHAHRVRACCDCSDSEAESSLLQRERRQAALGAGKVSPSPGQDELEPAAEDDDGGYEAGAPGPPGSVREMSAVMLSKSSRNSPRG